MDYVYSEDEQVVSDAWNHLVNERKPGESI